MNRIIVNIVSEQTIPNYLFIREMFQEGDRLLFISSQRFVARIEWIKESLGFESTKVDSVIFPEGGEERWVDMENKLSETLSNDNFYIVNLTGGTKYMSLLIQHVFERYHALFFYIPFPKNVILKPMENEAIPLKYRLTVQEYLSNYNVSFSEKNLLKDESYNDYLFDRFLNNSLNYKVIDLLRAYRNCKKKAISSIENALPSEKYPAIQGLEAFVKDIHFQLSESGFLKRAEIEYLTGGWFEEYIYCKIKRFIKPQDIKLGVLIKRTANTNQNDLDVVFTSGNKLFVIECKTGILGVKMFNETVYKATAIKEAVLGLSANTFIFSLASEDNELKNTAKNMGIYYKCREDFDSSDRMGLLMNQIKEIAKD